MEIKALLDLSTRYGFNENLWQNYLTFVLVTNENSFSLTAERVGAGEGSVNHFAKADLEIFHRLFHYDFSPLERDLGIDCFSTICHYKAIGKKERMYNKNVSEKVQAVSRQIEGAEDEEALIQEDGAADDVLEDDMPDADLPAGEVPADAPEEQTGL